jgi:two-component system chemotaxis response regulator CheB
MSKIRVLTVDDSALMRQVLTSLLSKDPGIEVVGTASDPYIAREKIKALHPDVLTLDVEMPKMDGLTFLEKLMRGHPMPVVMVSSLTEVGCQTTLRALELGAVDFITKPKIDLREGMEEVANDLIAKVKAAAAANVKGTGSAKRCLPPSPLLEGGQAPAQRREPAPTAMIKTTDTIIAIGASAGGTEAVKDVLMALPPNAPPIVITQHMPEHFTRSWADRMNSLTRLSVKEAKDGDSVLPGHALVAPGNYHMTLVRSGARYSVRISQGEPVNRHRPSVDVMFDSIAQYAGINTVGVILTGMGGDGAKGMLKMKQAGAYTIAQDEASCVVFGMPREAIKLGGVDKVLPLTEIAAAIVAHVSKR